MTRQPELTALLPAYWRDVKRCGDDWERPAAIGELTSRKRIPFRTLAPVQARSGRDAAAITALTVPPPPAPTVDGEVSAGGPTVRSDVRGLNG